MFEVLAEFLPRNVRPSVGITRWRGRIGRLRCQKVLCADGRSFKHIQLVSYLLLVDTFVVKRPKPIYFLEDFSDSFHVTRPFRNCCITYRTCT